jgi:uncharacterized protein YndB with AHSA1/START domain
MTTTATKIEDREIIISRVLNAPAALVWDVWTKPEHVINWWGPFGFTTTSHSMDVRPGGVWRFIMHSPDGTDYPNKIVFLEVIPHEKLVYKHSDDTETESVNFHVTITLENMGSKTGFTLRSVFESAAELERVNKEYGAIEGAKQHVSRLEEYLINAKHIK